MGKGEVKLKTYISYRLSIAASVADDTGSKSSKSS